MTRYVIGPDTAMALAEQRAHVAKAHRLFAPTLLRSQVLAQLYAEVHAGRLGRKDAGNRLDYLRGLQIRLLGDRVLQATAWRLAEQLGWQDTFVAEYLALTKLQADALVVRDEAVRAAASRVVAVARYEDLLG
jgi:predicted nucleic acid-binding protein